MDVYIKHLKAQKELAEAARVQFLSLATTIHLAVTKETRGRL